MAINTDKLTVREAIELGMLGNGTLLGRDSEGVIAVPQSRFQPADPSFSPTSGRVAFARKFRGSAPTGTSSFQLANIDPSYGAMSEWSYVGTARAVITGNIASGMGATILNFAGGSTTPAGALVSSSDYNQSGSPIISLAGAGTITLTCAFTTSGSQSSPRIIFWELDLIVAGSPS